MSFDLLRGIGAAQLPVQIVVIAKEPLPGRVKTRLVPPFTAAQAALMAAAALEDTLATVAATPARHRVLALDGRPGAWLPEGFTVLPQRGEDLGERITATLSDVYARAAVPMVLIGMDTPQVTPRLLRDAMTLLNSHDAVFGPATDGGFWLLGLRRPDAELLHDVPMSQPETGAALLSRLEQAGLDVAMLPRLTDVDTADDAAHVASRTPGSRFARAWAGMVAHATGGDAA